MNCKPGDLAIIVRDPFPENIGRIVEVKRPAEVVLDAPAWFCVARGTPLRIVNIDFPYDSYLGDRGDVYDVDLKPVSGLPITDDVTEEITA